MEMSKQEYQKFVQARAKSSPIVKDCVLAFAIGGGICVVGQLIMDGFTALGLERTDAGTATSISLVFLSALLTGLNLYNKLARYGGAGTLVPRERIKNRPDGAARQEGLAAAGGHLEAEVGNAGQNVLIAAQDRRSLLPPEGGKGGYIASLFVHQLQITG